MKQIYGECINCGGNITEKLAQKGYSRHGLLIAVIENVPTGVCEQCGDRYYKSDVTERIETLLAQASRSTRQINLPLIGYAA